MTAPVYTFATNKHIVHLQWVDFVVCKLCLNKAVEKKLRKNLKVHFSTWDSNGENLFIQQIFFEFYYVPGTVC